MREKKRNNSQVKPVCEETKTSLSWVKGRDACQITPEDQGIKSLPKTRLKQLFWVLMIVVEEKQSRCFKNRLQSTQCLRAEGASGLTAVVLRVAARVSTYAWCTGCVGLSFKDVASHCVKWVLDIQLAGRSRMQPGHGRSHFISPALALHQPPYPAHLRVLLTYKLTNEH